MCGLTVSTVIAQLWEMGLCTRMKLDVNRLQKVMTNFPGLKSETQLKELLLQEAEDEESWIDWKQGKDLRDEETHLSPPASPPTSSTNSPLDL